MVDKAQRAPVIQRLLYIQHVHGFPDEPGEFHIQPVGSGHASRRVTHGMPVGVKGGNGVAVADMDALQADKVKQGAQRVTVPLEPEAGRDKSCLQACWYACRWFLYRHVLPGPFVPPFSAGQAFPSKSSMNPVSRSAAFPPEGQTRGRPNPRPHAVVTPGNIPTCL